MESLDMQQKFIVISKLENGFNKEYNVQYWNFVFKMGAKFYEKPIWQTNTSINKAEKHIFYRLHDFRWVNLVFIIWNLVLYGYAVMWHDI